MIDPEMMAHMLLGGTWELTDYAFSDVHVLDVGSDSVIAAYRVTAQLTVDGRPVRLEAFDTSLWQRVHGEWTCALHTESLAGDPYGRDKINVTPD